MISISPVQKGGMQFARSVNVIMPWSTGERRLSAERMPAGMAINTASPRLDSARINVLRKRSSTSGATGTFSWLERPRSPCSAWDSHSTYCTGIGWSSPNDLRTRSSSAGVACGPAIIDAGSPGVRRRSTKTSTEMPSNTGTVAATRPMM